MAVWLTWPAPLGSGRSRRRNGSGSVANAAYCTACCRLVEDFVAGGRGGSRARARCPRCNALERHRFLAILLDHLAPAIHGHARVLDIAPSRFVTRRLASLAPSKTVRIDLDPAADARRVDACASLTQLPFASASFDLALCYHVLEHIPDDASAMRELARVLRDDGLALVQVPFRTWRQTDEDPSAGHDERIRRFGQADHVRWYGTDFDERLASAGLTGVRVQPTDVVGDDVVTICGLNPDENVWLLHRATAAPVSVEATGDLTLRTVAGLGTMARQGLQATELAKARQSTVAQLEAQLASAQRAHAAATDEAERWRLRYTRLRGHFAVDLLARLSRPARRALRRLRSTRKG